MNPTLSARQRVIRASERLPRSWPWTTTWPRVARSSPAIRLSRVVLPEPEGPIKARYSPSSTLRSRSTRTGMRNSSRRYSLVTPRRTIECTSPMALQTPRDRGEGGRAEGKGRTGRPPPLLGHFHHVTFAQRLRRVEHDGLPRLQARLDAGQVVVGHGGLDRSLADGGAAVDHPGEFVPVLLEQRRLGDEE